MVGGLPTYRHESAENLAENMVGSSDASSSVFSASATSRRDLSEGSMVASPVASGNVRPELLTWVDRMADRIVTMADRLVMIRRVWDRMADRLVTICQGEASRQGLAILLVGAWMKSRVPAEWIDLRAEVRDHPLAVPPAVLQIGLGESELIATVVGPPAYRRLFYWDSIEQSINTNGNIDIFFQHVPFYIRILSEIS